MFSTYPEHEFHSPEGLGPPIARHWRRMEILTHTRWFLLTVELSGQDPEASVSHTWCIAWDCDLVNMLDTIDPTTIRGLVCMLPAWATPARQWAAREVAEVWLTRTEAAEQFLSLTDTRGEQFGGTPRLDRTAMVSEKRLLLQLKPPSVKSRSVAGRSRKSMRDAQPAPVDT